MPRLSRFRLERKITPDKVRKHSIIIKQNSPPQFQKLFLEADLTLPPKLQTFLSQLRFPDSESVRNNSSKVRVVLKITECRDTPSCITVKKDQNCVGVIDPTPSRRSQNSNTNVNLFTFDSVLTDSDSPDFLFNNALVDPILDLIKGKDSCIFSFGHAGLGKTESMIGRDLSIHKIGIIPCALVWIFKIIRILEVNTNVRYSVHISAKEVSSKNIVRDLLTNSREYSSSGSAGSADSRATGAGSHDRASAAGGGSSSHRKVPASNIREAAAILDSALATRSNDNDSVTHLQLIIHLCQHRPDANEHSNESNNLAKVESRLYLLDLGSGRHGNEDQKILSLQGMSKVILALYTSQRHIAYKDNVLTQLLKDTLNPNISTTMVLHISSKEQNYSETLQVVQLAAKLHRMHLKKYRSVGFSVSDEASSCSSSSSGFQSRRLRPHMGIGAARRSSGNSSASSEFDLTSASELSCCETVIFRGDDNHIVGDKSPDRFAGKRKLRPVSSESDNCFSDKDSSKSLTCSSGTIASPSVIRRRRTSPRTNARAWPSTNESFNGTRENGSELWVDGPNAVYKVEKMESKLKNNDIQNFLFLEPVVKPIMISKETQCDDVWDSASSITDGSSHSNTLDRKDHRPLSDISECTEETESNVATESELGKMNMTDQIETTNVLDDLLESTFGLTPIQNGNQMKPLGHTFLNSQNIGDVHLQFLEKMTKPSETTNVENGNEMKRNTEENKTHKEPVEQHIQKSTNLIDNKKHYHSASDSKRSSRSDNKGRRSKSRCRKCSRKSENHCSKSMSSSNSTDFSRVTSWIENVEYEIQSFNTQEWMNKQIRTVHDTNQMHHHHSQPDISYQWDFFNANRSHFYPLHCQYQIPSNNQLIHNDAQQPQYSLYDGFKMTLNNSHSNPSSSSSHASTHLNTAVPPVPPLPPVQHMVKSRESVSMRQILHHSPKPRRTHSNVSNISLPTNSISVSHQPLPPLPKSSVFVDTYVSQNEIHNKPHSFNRPSSTSSATTAVPTPTNIKCKTLPRDIYLDSVSRIKRNQSEPHHSKSPHFSTAANELKFKEKSKMEAKKILSIIFSPFIHLKKKINRSKANSDINLGFGEVENKSLENRSNLSAHQLSDWSPVVRKMETNLVLTSPYNLVTQPKTGILATESSGHGSDSSSLHNRDLLKAKSSDLSHRHKSRSGSVTHNSRNIHRQRPTSSGYGSIIIKGDSEVSSHNDSSSEYSLTGFTNSKVVGASQSRMKHSRSLSNYKSLLDASSSNAPKPDSAEVSNLSCSMERNVNFHENVKIAEDLLIQEKLKISLKEERRIVIQLIETNRLRGIPIDVSVMNLMCFKCVDNFDVSSPVKRNECELLIAKIVQEIELLKQKLVQAQHHLFLITSFDCNPHPQ